MEKKEKNTLGRGEKVDNSFILSLLKAKSRTQSLTDVKEYGYRKLEKYHAVRKKLSE